MKNFRKLVVALILAVALSTVASASDIDFSGKTMEELLDIRNAVDEAIFETGEAVVIEQGKYTGGKDIAVGSYLLNVYGEDGDSITVYLWKSASSEDDYHSAWNEWKAQYSSYKDDNTLGYPEAPSDSTFADICEEYVHSGESLRVNVEEGSILDIRISSYDDINGITIEKASGLFMD